MADQNKAGLTPERVMALYDEAICKGGSADNIILNTAWAIEREVRNLAATPAVPAPDAPPDDDELFAAKFYSSARPAPDVGGLIPEQDERWVPAEQAAFSAWAINAFPNESSKGLISLGSAWKQGQAYALAAHPADAGAAPTKLSEQQVADMLTPDIVTEVGRRALLNGDTLYASLAFLTRFANAVLAIQAAPEAASDPDEPTDREQLIACLGDDAATLIAQNPDDEMAQTMLDAAAMLEATSEQMGGAQVAKVESMIGPWPTVEMTVAGMRCLKNTKPEHLHKYAAGIANSVYEAMSEASPIAAPTTESAAAPADLSNGAVWAVIDAAMPLLAQYHCPALLALSKGDKEIFARAILAKNRAAEGKATSERKPLTDAEMWQVAAKEQGTQLDRMKCEVIVLECPADVRDLYRAIERQHHGIGSDK